MNGALGPFAFEGTQPKATSIPHRDAMMLQASGCLQRGNEPSTLRMPRVVRALFRHFAHMGTGSEVDNLHRRLAAEPIQGKTLSTKLEIHRHAVLARDVERAKSTAIYYGTELRDLATQLSLERQFAKAAELFEYVVTTFDESDAYAWEYLGYNLARANDVANRDRVLHAYEVAHSRWPENPLYHGRLLGFRGQIGRDIVDEFVKSLDRYVNKFGDEQEAVSFFTEATLKGLRRGKQDGQVTRIVTRKRTLLERFAGRALAGVSDDE